MFACDKPMADVFTFAAVPAERYCKQEVDVVTRRS